jgi:hypothetical protein
MRTVATQWLASPPGAPVPYEYDLTYAATSGIIPSQRYVARSGSLATVDAHYYYAADSIGAQDRYGLYPVQFQAVPLVPVHPLGLPGHQIYYLTGNPAIAWSAGLGGSAARLPFIAGGQSDVVRTFRAGEQATENWNGYPLHPAANVNLAGVASPRPTLPSASRAGDTLTLDSTPFSDDHRQLRGRPGRQEDRGEQRDGRGQHA